MTEYHQAASRPTGARPSILLCTNSLFLQHAAACIVSLLNNNPDLCFDIVVVGRATENLDKERLQLSLSQFPNHSLRVLSFTLPENCPLPLNPRAHYTLDNWTRLWVDEFFPDDVDRVLYLDSDIIVVDSIAPLWNVDLGGALLGAVDIPGSQRGVTTLGMRAEDGYFNSGVMLIDLKQWRKIGALGMILDYVSAYPERLHDLDQDALNACFHNHRKRLEYKWNVIRPYFREPLALPLPRAEVEKVRREARIIHFNGASKPWSYFCDHPRREEYQKYLSMTEWRNFVPEDRTMLNRIRKGMASILPKKIKNKIRALIA